MMGDFASLAASRDATTVEDDVTLIAGMANSFSCAYLKSFRTSSPLVGLGHSTTRWKFVQDNAALASEDVGGTHFEILVAKGRRLRGNCKYVEDGTMMMGQGGVITTGRIGKDRLSITCGG
jgi:hypothetical protein